MVRTFAKVALSAAVAGMSATAFGQALEEVVVTAQKRTQSLQDVPISVTAISGEQIQNSIRSFSASWALTYRTSRYLRTRSTPSLQCVAFLSARTSRLSSQSECSSTVFTMAEVVRRVLACLTLSRWRSCEAPRAFYLVRTPGRCGEYSHCRAESWRGSIRPHRSELRK